MTSYAIRTDQLSYAYGKRPVLNNISLLVPTGSIFGFLGPNGSGKTTTIRLLLGLIQTPRSCITLFGQDLKKHRLPILSRIGALIEAPILYPQLSGYDNMEIGRLARQVDRRQISNVLEMVGLSHDSRRKVNEYSLGMRQRLGIALALLGDPVLLILDEPTNGLDPAGIREIRKLLTDLSQLHGKTIFISSHLLSEMEKLVTHVAILNEGNLLFQGSIDQLRRKHAMPETSQENGTVSNEMTLEDLFLNLTNPLQ